MAPIFVGSTDDDSRIRDNRVGFAISTANPGSASEGDIYFNSTDKQLRGYDGSAWAAIGGGGGGTAEFTVSGTLSNGQTVILKSDGNVAGVTTTQITQTTGFTTTTYHSGNTSEADIVWDASNQKVVVAYRDQVDGDKGKAVVGTINGTSISFGSAVTFDSGRAEYISAVYDSTNEKVVIGYIDNNNQNHGRAIVGTVSGTSISFGSVTDFSNNNASEDIACKYIKGVHDPSNNKIIFAFQETTNSNKGKAIVGTVSGTSISFGERAQFESGQTWNIATTFDTSSNKFVVIYRDASDNRGKASIGTVSGTDITFGSEYTFETGNTYHTGVAFDSENNKVVIAYKDASDNSYGKVRIGTVSGSVITYGTEVIFSTQNTNDTNVTYDPIAKKVLILFRDNSDSNSGKYQVGTVVGTGITFAYQQNNDNLPAFNAATGGGYYPKGVFASTENVIPFIFRNESNNYYQEASVFRNAYVATNLTSTNFLGFSDAAYTNGQSATIQMVGAVDDAQTGLTTATRLFVQTDGTLSTTAGDPSVLAGTAISGTKIIVRK